MVFLPDLSTFRRSDSGSVPSNAPDLSIPRFLCSLFAPRVFHNSFAIKRFHILSKRNAGCHSTIPVLELVALLGSPTLPLLSATRSPFLSSGSGLFWTFLYPCKTPRYQRDRPNGAPASQVGGTATGGHERCLRLRRYRRIVRQAQGADDRKIARGKGAERKTK